MDGKRFVLLVIWLVIGLHTTFSQSMPPGKWVVTSVRGTGLHSQSWATRKAFPADYIQAQWDAGKFISDLYYGNGIWSVVMSEGTNYSEQTWATRQEFPADLIQEMWDAGMGITQLAYGQSAWAMVFSRRADIGPQTYQLSTQFPQSFIEENWKAGYYIECLSYGQGQWLVVMSKGKSKRQAFIKSRKFPQDWLSARLDEDQDLSHLLFHDGYWVAVAGRESWYYAEITSSVTFPKSQIANAWSGERAITGIRYGDQEGEALHIHTQVVKNLTAVSEQPETSRRFHLFTVMDTDDRVLGAGARQALNMVEGQFKALATSLDLPIVQYSVFAGDFSREKAWSTLEAMKVDSQDVVLLYYFGHGFRYTNSTSRYPVCYFGENGVDHPRDAGLPLTDLYRALVQKGAGLTLVFAECCNNEIGMAAPVDKYLASRPMSVSAPSLDRYRKLFLESRGSILLASSDAGQASWTTSAGGYFLESFLDALHHQVSEQNRAPVSWRLLLNDAQERTRHLASSRQRVQEPIFSIQIQN